MAIKQSRIMFLKAMSVVQAEVVQNLFGNPEKTKYRICDVTTNSTYYKNKSIQKRK